MQIKTLLEGPLKDQLVRFRWY